MSESRRGRRVNNGAETRARRRPAAMAPLDRLSEVRTCRRPGLDDIAFGHNRVGHLETGDRDPLQSGSIGHIRPDRLGAFQSVFGMVFTVIIALEFKRTLVLVTER